MIFYQSCENICGCGGTGRRARFRFLCPSGVQVRFLSSAETLKRVGLAHSFLCLNSLKNWSIFHNSMKNSIMLCQNLRSNLIISSLGNFSVEKLRTNWLICIIYHVVCWDYAMLCERSLRTIQHI